MSDESSYGHIRSTKAVVTKFCDDIDKYLLQDDEKLNSDPTSFTSLLANTLGTITELNFYEYLMAKRETNRNTAILKSTLLSDLNDKQLTGIYGTPSTLTLMISFSEEDIINNSVPIGSGFSRLVLNRGFTIKVGDKPEFTLINDVEILVSPVSQYNEERNIIAKSLFDPNDIFDDSDSPFLKTNTYFTKEFGKLFSIYLPFYQFQRESHYATSGIGKPIYYKDIVYKDNLVGFEVWLIDGEKRTRLSGRHIDIDNPTGFNYTLSERGKDKLIEITFGRKPSSLKPTDNQEIEVIVYTSKGADGNFSIPYTALDQINVVRYPHEPDDDYQSPFARLKPIITLVSSSAIGGRNELTTEEIREKGKIEYNSAIITSDQIEYTIKNLYGYKCRKIRSDVYINYMMYGSIRGEFGELVSTKLSKIQFNFKDLHVVDELATRTISPKMVFSNSTDASRIVTDPVPYNEYIDRYEAGLLNQLVSPFHIRVKTADRIKISTWDMAADVVARPTTFIYYNNYSLSEVNIQTVDLLRSPLDDVVDETGRSSGEYHINAKVRLSSSLINNLIANADDYMDGVDLPPLKVYMTFKNEGRELIGTRPCTIDYYGIKDNSVPISFTLPTDNMINDSELLNIVNSTLQDFPRQSIVPPNRFLNDFELGIYVMLRNDGIVGNEVRSSYSGYVSATDKDLGYYMSAVYKVEDLYLMKDITKQMHIISDLKVGQPKYLFYESDVYKYYTEDVLLMGEDDEPVISPKEIIVDGDVTLINTTTVLHKKGEPVLDEVTGEHVVLHRAGDVVYINGVPQIDTEAKTDIICTLHNVPMFDRVYAIGDQFKLIRSRFRELADNISGIKMISGVALKMGVVNTSGPGAFKFLNTHTQTMEVLNDMSLSIELFPEFEQVTGINEEDLRSRMVDEVITYVNEHKPGATFSVDKMLNHIKKTIPNIDSIRVGSVNNVYKPGVLQSIIPVGDVDSNDTLCIKFIIDRINSDFDNGIVKFKPDIQIR